jgi:hypothetical protein
MQRQVEPQREGRPFLHHEDEAGDQIGDARRGDQRRQIASAFARDRTPAAGRRMIR